MSETITIRKGLDLPIGGAAEPRLTEAGGVVYRRLGHRFYFCTNPPPRGERRIYEMEKLMLKVEVSSPGK